MVVVREDETIIKFDFKIWMCFTVIIIAVLIGISWPFGYVVPLFGIAFWSFMTCLLIIGIDND